MVTFINFIYELIIILIILNINAFKYQFRI